MEMESRVSTLEEKARAQEVLNDHNSVKLDAIVAGIGRLETLAAIASAKACPAPGKCLALEEENKRLWAELESLASDLKKINRYISEQKGGWKVLVLIAGTAGSMGAFISWLFSNFNVHTKGPNP